MICSKNTQTGGHTPSPSVVCTMLKLRQTQDGDCKEADSSSAVNTFIFALVGLTPGSPRNRPEDHRQIQNQKSKEYLSSRITQWEYAGVCRQIH